MKTTQNIYVLYMILYKINGFVYKTVEKSYSEIMLMNACLGKYWNSMFFTENYEFPLKTIEIESVFHRIA